MIVPQENVLFLILTPVQFLFVIFYVIFCVIFYDLFVIFPVFDSHPCAAATGSPVVSGGHPAETL